MIRTVIEVQAETQWEFEVRLTSALANLGFEPKPSGESVLFRADLCAALQARGIEPHALVEEYRSKPKT